MSLLLNTTMPENRVSAELTAEDLDAIQGAIATIRERLPFLVDLSTEERTTMLKMGDKSRAFVEKMMEVIDQNPDFLPRSFDEVEMRKDVELFLKMYPVYLALTQLKDLVDDTLMLVGSEAYAAALVAYRYAKDAELGSGLEQIVDDLGRRFARRARQAAAEATTPEAQG